MENENVNGNINGNINENVNENVNGDVNGNVNGNINGNINIPSDVLNALLKGDRAYYSPENDDWYVMSEDEYWDYERSGGQWVYRPLDGWVDRDPIPPIGLVVRRLVAGLSASDVVRPEVLRTIPDIAQDLCDGRLVRYYPDDHVFRSILWSEHVRCRACGLPGFRGVLEWMLPEEASALERDNAVRLDRMHCREFEANIRWPEPVPDPE